MPRSIWNGTISVGLAHVPIKLYSATESKTVSFHEVHLKDGARLEHKRICSKEDKEVPYKEVVKGFEVAADEFVVLEKDEVAAAAGARGKVIEIEEFVPDDEIDPVFYEKTYYVGCRDDGEAYRVFHEALKQTERVGIGRFTFHNREYLAAIRPYEKILVLHTMRFADELVGPEDLELPKLGRKAAHELVADAAARLAADGGSLRDALAADESFDLSPAELDAALDPCGYLGYAPALAAAVLSRYQSIFERVP